MVQGTIPSSIGFLSNLLIMCVELTCTTQPNTVKYNTQMTQIVMWSRGWCGGYMMCVGTVDGVFWEESYVPVNRSLCIIISAINQYLNLDLELDFIGRVFILQALLSIWNSAVPSWHLRHRWDFPLYLSSFRDFTDNNLRGRIPSSFGNLHQLVHMYTKKRKIRWWRCWDQDQNFEVYACESWSVSAHNAVAGCIDFDDHDLWIAYSL